MRASSMAVVALAGCGRIGFDPTGPNALGNVFEAVTLPLGGMATGVEGSAVQPNRLCSVAGGRVFRSDDRGARWSECGRTGLVWPLAVDPGDADVIYVGDPTG